MSSWLHSARRIVLPALCSALLLFVAPSRAEQRSPTASAPAASAPSKPAKRQTSDSRALSVCDPGATATRPTAAAKKTASKGGTTSSNPCFPWEDIEKLLDREFLDFHTNTLERVEIHGYASRDDYTVCVGRDCEASLTSLAEAVEHAANALGGWKEEIGDAVSPKLQRCATAAPTNNTTVDRDRASNYLVARDAVLVAYGDGLHTIREWSRVDVRYNVGGTYTFWITDVNADARSFNLSRPTEAKAGGPCS